MKHLFSLLSLLAAPFAAHAADAPKGTKPNIVFILADDLGVGNVGCYGADGVKTPNIDALAKGGTRYTHAYTATLCGPSRALILTGRYAFRTGATNQDATGLMKPTVETFLPKLLKPAGYASSCIGKWGQLPAGPAECGFTDYWKFKGSGKYWNTQTGASNYEVNGKTAKLNDKEYIPDLMHRHAVEFITNQRDKPFFLYYSLSHVHAEILPTPDSAPDSKDLYADNLAYMDKLVGKLVAELDRLKLRENTLIVFFGDNGTGKAHAAASTVGGKKLSGEKGSMLEGNAHVPLIVNWPGVTPAGKVSADLIDASDFVPTFAELAGAKLPEKTAIDGRSFAPQLRGEKGTPRDWIFIQLANMWYARETGWKLNENGELYDMSDAPFTEKLVATDLTDEKAIAARKRLEAALKQLNPAGGIKDTGDGTGRHAKGKKDPEPAAEKPPTPKTGTAPDNAPAPKPVEKPAAKLNVLFIAVDDLRPEIGCYGNTVVKTPNLDRLAARGTVFTHSYCQQAVCSPSRSSILTGRRPDATKVYDLVTHFRTALPDAVTLPQHFKSNGYHTTALSKVFHRGYEDGRSWSEPHWYPNGQTVDTDPNDSTKRIVKKYAGGVELTVKEDGAKGPAFEVSKKDDDELADGFTAKEAVKRLHDLKEKTEPFFLAVGFLKPHLPFVAPKKYWDLYDPDKIPVPTIATLPKGAPSFAGHTNGELHSYTGVPKDNPIPADFAKKLRHGYYACISYTDAQVGRLLDALDKEGLADNTVIVLWGDHGWQLGEHGLWHKHTNFELAARAPLFISVPKQKATGKKFEAPVEFVDVYPTLAEVCGLPIPAGLDGISLKAVLDDPTVAFPKKVAISQYPRGGAKAEAGQLMGYSIRDDRWRLTLWRNRKTGAIAATELYDEKNDPDETVNVADKPDNKAVIEALSKHLPPLPKP